MNKPASSTPCWLKIGWHGQFRRLQTNIVIQSGHNTENQNDTFIVHSTQENNGSTSKHKKTAIDLSRCLINSRDGREDSKVRDVTSDHGREEVLVAEGLQLEREEEGDEAEEDAEQEDVGNVMTAERFVSADQCVVRHELKDTNFTLGAVIAF
jgi:hypothetical protein